MNERTPSVRRLGAGLDNAAYLVDDLVVRFRRADPAGVAREADLLRLVATVSPIAVPVPEIVDPARGCLAYRSLPGTPLLHVAERDAAALGARLGGFLAALHATEPPAAECDDTPPAEWREEASSLWPGVRPHVPEQWHAAVEAFLAAPPPVLSPGDLVFSHQDLGAEHVLVDPGTGQITGIIDWSDAAVGDAARDLGLILRDLGPVGFEAALAVVGRSGSSPVFYARCGLIADLSYGMSAGREIYRDRALAALTWLF